MSLKIYITFDEKFSFSLSCISYLEGGDSKTHETARRKFGKQKKISVFQ